MNRLFFLLALFVVTSAQAQPTLSKKEFSINAFRAPSIGAEFRYQHVSVHAGYYLTAFSGVTNNFAKAGLTYWFLPVGKQPNPSSFYAGASYLRGLDNDYKDLSALGIESGFRWMIWKGLNLRIGVIVVSASGKSTQVNPAGGLSYSFFFD
ncbi:MAG: hypothetical protein JNK10_11770 [Cyclobacteriaceae bacterium]|nr:hypothetical protein [Cyclobacteriaceae bacterium]